jgi:hypothetical protein
MAGVVASLSVVASLDDLFETPARFGWNHDLTVSDASPDDITDLVANDSLAAVTEVREGDVAVDGTTVPALFLTPRKGTTEETLLEGRMPAGPGEVALGPELAADLGVGLEGDVTVAGPNGGSSAMRVVGIALTASPGQYAGRAMFDGAALDRVSVRNAFTEAFVVIDPAAERTSVIDELARRKEVSLPEHPAALLNLIQTRSVIRLFAVFLGIVAVAAIAHVLAVTTARRRRELAVLRALGLTGRQLGLSIGAMTMVLVTAGLLLGVPVGLVVSTATWRAMTDAMHLPGDVTVPVLMISLLACAAWVIGAVLSLSPAHRAATLPASALRTE